MSKFLKVFSYIVLSLLFQSTVFLEPFSFDASTPIEHSTPALMYGTELASIGHPIPCSVKGLDYNQFYKIWKCPRIVVEVAVRVVGRLTCIAWKHLAYI